MAKLQSGFPKYEGPRPPEGRPMTMTERVAHREATAAWKAEMRAFLRRRGRRVGRAVQGGKTR